MASYVLFYTGGGMAETEAERQAILQAWNAWFGKLGSALVDGGNPFTGNIKTIASNGVVSNGPVGTPSTGYSIIKADSFEAAVELAKSCPALQSGSKVTVYETFKVM
jgi:hypothetical protein